MRCRRGGVTAQFARSSSRFAVARTPTRVCSILIPPISADAVLHSRTAEGELPKASPSAEGASFHRREILEAKAFRTSKAKPINKGGASDQGASAKGVGAQELTAEGEQNDEVVFSETKASVAHASCVLSNISSGGVCAEGASPKTTQQRSCCQRHRSRSLQVDAMAKVFANLKVHVVGSRDKRKSPTEVRSNLWCTNCGMVSHANVKCRPYQPVNTVEWVPA